MTIKKTFIMVAQVLVWGLLMIASQQPASGTNPNWCTVCSNCDPTDGSFLCYKDPGTVAGPCSVCTGVATSPVSVYMYWPSSAVAVCSGGSTSERPKETEGRTIPGHWEGDLVVGRFHKSAVGTLVERTTRTVILVPLEKKDATSVREAFERELASLPDQMKLSMTYDRGKEMTEHKLFTEHTKMQVYFADPYSPWQRGTNENTNGLIREYFPKGTDFSKVTRQQIKRVQNLLNGRPRKVLGFETPKEAFIRLINQNSIALEA